MITKLNLPEWYILSVNPYIYDNYRKPLSFINCILSLFTLHNETINIYTHLLPGLYFIYSLYNVFGYNYYINALIKYKFCILFGYISAIIMCLTSAFAHTFYIINKKWSNYSWKLDFIGIIIINLSHQIYDSILYSNLISNNILYFIVFEILFALYCILRILNGNIEVRRYWGITYPIMSSTVLTIPLFIYSQYFSTNIILNNAISGSLKCSILVFTSGLFFFTGKFPEKYYNPKGIFNNFNSHTIHHILIILSILSCFKSIHFLHLLN
jgi:adiponectin receptor